MRFVWVFVLLTMALSAGSTAAMAQEPTPPHPDSGELFSKAYVEASRLLQDAMHPGSADRKETLLLGAIGQFTDALRESPEDINAYINRGVTFYRLGQYDRAIADYSDALGVEPRLADAIKNRGLAYEQQGRLSEAVADFETFLNLIADMPTERRADERAFFTARVEELRSQLGESEIQAGHPTITTGLHTSEYVPEWWAWVYYYGNAVAHNDTYKPTCGGARQFHRGQLNASP